MLNALTENDWNNIQKLPARKILDFIFEKYLQKNASVYPKTAELANVMNK